MCTTKNWYLVNERDERESLSRIPDLPGRDSAKGWRDTDIWNHNISLSAQLVHRLDFSPDPTKHTYSQCLEICLQMVECPAESEELAYFIYTHVVEYRKRQCTCGFFRSAKNRLINCPLGYWSDCIRLTNQEEKFTALLGQIHAWVSLCFQATDELVDKGWTTTGSYIKIMFPN